MPTKATGKPVLQFLQISSWIVDVVANFFLTKFGNSTHLVAEKEIEGTAATKHLVFFLICLNRLSHISPNAEAGTWSLRAPSSCEGFLQEHPDPHGTEKNRAPI